MTWIVHKRLLCGAKPNWVVTGPRSLFFLFCRAFRLARSRSPLFFFLLALPFLLGILHYTNHDTFS